MRLFTTDTEAEFSKPDSETIAKVIRGLLENPEGASLAASKDGGMFMQTFPDDDSTFSVEYGTGDGTLYRTENALPIETVIGLFQSFNVGETSWKNDYPWMDVTKEMKEGSGFKQFSEKVKKETGRSIIEWAQLMIDSEIKDRAACKEWLKKEHRLSGSLAAGIVLSAWLIVAASRDPDVRASRSLRALVDRCTSAVGVGDLQEVENCAKMVEQVRAVLKTTDDSESKGWSDLFDRVAEQLKIRTTAKCLSEGVVYLLKAGPYYKIGNSINVEQRLNQIKLQLPYPVEQLHQILTDDPRGVEGYWHKRFSSKRTNGEWFLLTDEDVVIFRSRTRM